MSAEDLDYAVPASIEGAARSGKPEALFALGLMYCAGRMVEMDFVQAHMWFNLAATRGYSQAKSYRAEIAREMTPGDVARAQKRAREWLAVH